MICGKWLQDPANGPVNHETLGGLSNLILNTQVMKAFRRGLSDDPDERTTARQWQTILMEVAEQVFLCPGCSYPNMIDASKQSCPACKQPYPILAIQLRGGPAIAINQAAVIIGRPQLTSHHVSAKHAVLRRIGLETWIESFGSNGTYRWSESDGWIRLPDTRRQLIEAGDRLRFADVETQVCIVGDST